MEDMKAAAEKFLYEHSFDCYFEWEDYGKYSFS
jgi:hypothetical protein